MKRTLSMILAALLLASSLASCGNTAGNTAGKTETKGETQAPETKIVETAGDPAETEAPASSYDASLVTENGIAKAHIVIPENAEYQVQYGANDLVYHIKKVSGADVTVVNAVEEGSLPIIIATPDSLPELEALFPEDLAWLRETKDANGKSWGDDGFAIRSHEGKVYIFGANQRGALNGVYEFIEENMGVIWTRADEEIGLFYDEMPTISVIKTNYREKSPFDMRGWQIFGRASYDDKPTTLMMSRNKLNATYAQAPVWGAQHMSRVEYCLEPVISGHNIKNMLLNSPIYDPNITEYWNTNSNGVRQSAHDSIQVNFWSDLTAKTIAATLLKLIDDSQPYGGIQYVSINPEDWDFRYNLPESELPFEYAPGQFVNPGDKDYLSTVVLTFVNKIAAIIGEKYPNVNVCTFAYNFVSEPPRCEIADNVAIEFCTFQEDSTSPIYEPVHERPADMLTRLKGWMEKTDKIYLYTYYGCYVPAAYYIRPMWYTMQKDLQYYAENNFVGLCPQGWVDYDCPFCYELDDNDAMIYYQGNEGSELHTYSDAWTNNELLFWIYNKLLWNPNEDVDALITYFCDKVYGDASPYMQEFYNGLAAGFHEGAEMSRGEYNFVFKWSTTLTPYMDYCVFNDDFVENANLAEKLLTALSNAWDAADDKAKGKIKYIKEMMEQLNEEWG